MKIIFLLSKVVALVVFFINSFWYCMCELSLRTHDEHSEGLESTSCCPPEPAVWILKLLYRDLNKTP